MANDLAKYNIVPNKTYTYEPVALDPELMSHYFRGYFDGDGCLTVWNKKYEYPCYYKVSIAGFRHNLIKMAALLDSIGIHLSFVEDNRKYRNNLRFGKIVTNNKKVTFIFLKYIYRDCSGLYLPRKKKLSDRFFNVYTKEKKHAI